LNVALVVMRSVNLGGLQDQLQEGQLINRPEFLNRFHGY
jgi:hypothetical protein